MNDGKARLALVLNHQNPFLLDTLTLAQRLAVEEDLNALAMAEVPGDVWDGWSSGDPLMLQVSGASPIELVPRGATWTQVNLQAYLAQEAASIGTGYTTGTAFVATCRICPPPDDHEDRSSIPIHLNRAPWTVSATVGATTFVAEVWLEILVVFPQDG
jgi:hypothetical protein